MASMLIAGVSSYIGMRQAPRTYQSTVTVMIGQSLEMLNPTERDIYLSRQLAQTYAQLVERGPMIEAAAEDLGLESVPDTVRVTTREVPGTNLLEINVLDTHPERAHAMADAISQQLVMMTPAARELAGRSEFLDQQLNDLEMRIIGVEDEIEREQSMMATASSARAVLDHQNNISILQQQLTSYRNSYTTLLANTQAASNRITVIEPAELPEQPVGPGVMNNVLLAMAIGLALSGTGVLALELLDGRVRTAAEAAQITDLRLLTTIAPRETESEGKLVTVDDPVSPDSEAFRILRTRIPLQSNGDPVSPIMITSPGPGEGKSLVVSNLGVVFAQAGIKAVIVDADFRRPSQHGLFDLDEGTGLSELLENPDLDLLDSVQSTEVDGLYLLRSGRSVSSPDRLLNSARFDSVLEDLEQHYQVVLVDSPPSTVFADAAILASHVDATLLVADVTRTHRSLLAQAADEFRRAGTDIIGLVVNRVKAPLSGPRNAYYAYLGDMSKDISGQQHESAAPSVDLKSPARAGNASRGDLEAERSPASQSRSSESTLS